MIPAEATTESTTDEAHALLLDELRKKIQDEYDLLNNALSAMTRLADSEGLQENEDIQKEACETSRKLHVSATLFHELGRKYRKETGGPSPAGEWTPQLAEKVLSVLQSAAQRIPEESNCYRGNILKRVGYIKELSPS